MASSPPTKMNVAIWTDAFIALSSSVLRPLGGFSEIQVAQFLLGGLLGLGWGTLYRERRLIFRFRLLHVAFLVQNSCQINVGPCQHHRILCCGVFPGGEAAENFLCPRAVAVEQ